TGERVDKFAAHRRRQRYTQFLTPRAVEPLLGYLRSLGAAPAPVPPPETRVDRFVHEYAGYLTAERGLVVTTIRAYTDFARHFIEVQFGADVADWRRLGAADVTDFVAREFPRLGVGECKRTVTNLRSLLRYLHVRGQIAHDLAACVPAVAGWRLASLPK